MHRFSNVNIRLCDRHLCSCLCADAVHCCHLQPEHASCSTAAELWAAPSPSCEGTQRCPVLHHQWEKVSQSSQWVSDDRDWPAEKDPVSQSEPATYKTDGSRKRQNHPPNAGLVAREVEVQMSSSGETHQLQVCCLRSSLYFMIITCSILTGSESLFMWSKIKILFISAQELYSKLTEQEQVVANSKVEMSQLQEKLWNPARCDAFKESLVSNPTQLQVRCLRSSLYFTIITCWILTTCAGLLHDQLFHVNTPFFPFVFPNKSPPN